MNDTPDPPDGDAAGRYDGLPAAWSESAKETHVQVEEANPTLDPVRAGSLFEACGLIALADAMQEQLDIDGLMIDGSRGQRVAHPLISEIRGARAQALSALRALGLALNQTTASKSGAALAAKRWHGRTAGVRAIQTAPSYEDGDQ